MMQSPRSAGQTPELSASYGEQLDSSIFKNFRHFRLISFHSFLRQFALVLVDVLQEILAHLAHLVINRKVKQPIQLLRER